MLFEKFPYSHSKWRGGVWLSKVLGFFGKKKKKKIVILSNITQLKLLWKLILVLIKQEIGTNLVYYKNDIGLNFIFKIHDILWGCADLTLLMWTF